LVRQRAATPVHGAGLPVQTRYVTVYITVV
jgi:hypothetical protein